VLASDGGDPLWFLIGVEVSLLRLQAFSIGFVQFFFRPLAAVLAVADGLLVGVAVEFLFLLLCARGKFTLGGGWLYRGVDFTGSVGFVFRPSASWPTATYSVLLFQVCFMGGRCVLNVQVFVHQCGVGNDSCGSSNVWRLGATRWICGGFGGRLRRAGSLVRIVLWIGGRTYM
jgi:hypothetical protein